MPKQPDPPLFHNANPGGRMLLPIFWTAGSKNYREAGQLALMGEPNQMYARDAAVFDVSLCAVSCFKSPGSLTYIIQLLRILSLSA